MEGRDRKRGIDLARIQDGESPLDVAVGTGLILAEVVRRNSSGFNAGPTVMDAMS